MNSIKHGLGILAVIVGMALLAGIVWYCMFGRTADSFTEGTLVERVVSQDGGAQIL